jgi:diguanylate cyclase (GGDEF)-like protein
MPNDRGNETPIFTNPNYINPETDSSLSHYLNALDKLDKTIYKDDLTGCYNRNFFENFKKNNFDANRDHNDLGLVFVDVNKLKETNDTLGHEAGDNLIKNTAIFLKSNFRKEDLVIRLGGDEFVVVCKNHENDSSFQNDLPKKITERLNNNPPVDFAFGIAVYDKEIDSSNLDNTQKRADDLMYQKKKEMKAERQV